MSATSNWAPNRLSTLGINGVFYPVSDGGLDEEYSKFDSTPSNGTANASGALPTEFGVDTVTTTFNATVLVDLANVQNVQGNRLYPCTWTDPAGNSHGGSAKILKRGRTIAAKGGFNVKISGEFTGLVTGQ